MANAFVDSEVVLSHSRELNSRHLESKWHQILRLMRTSTRWAASWEPALAKDIESDRIEDGARVHGRRSVMGRRDRRDSLRPFPGRGEPRGIFEKSKIARRSSACAFDAGRLAAYPLGQAGQPWRAARLRAGARAARRRDELEHVSGSTRAGALLQVRQLVASRPAVRRQAIEHNIECIRIGVDAWIPGADGMDRRWRKFSRADDIPAVARAISRKHARDLRRAARRLAHVHRAQAVRARVLLDRHQRLGHELLLSPASSGRRRSAWLIWGTTHPTSISR